MTDDKVGQKCGYVGLIGRPNVGKSTLLNHILRQKVSITSRKPQTTRKSALGVDTQGRRQAIYVDTPGIHKGGGKALNRFMVNQAAASAKDVDILVMVIDATGWNENDEQVLQLVRQQQPHLQSILAVLTKIDLLDNKNELLPQIERLAGYDLFDEIIPVCALKQEGIDSLRERIFHFLPQAPHLFAEDDVTDQTERQMVEEIVREKLMRQLGDELPHSSAVSIIKFDQQAPVTEIHAEIYVERASQKSMVIGRQGQRIKLIGSEARKDIEQLLQRQVMLNLWVKVQKGWTNNPVRLRQLGYE